VRDSNAAAPRRSAPAAASRARTAELPASAAALTAFLAAGPDGRRGGPLHVLPNGPPASVIGASVQAAPAAEFFKTARRVQGFVQDCSHNRPKMVTTGNVSG
jgi:hypothetical protein